MGKSGKSQVQQILALLPAVETVLLRPEIEKLTEIFSREYISFLTRDQINLTRESLKKSAKNATKETLITGIIKGVVSSVNNSVTGSVIPAINATGVVLHTGLGRAPLSREAISRIKDVLSGYSTVEIDKSSGSRGKRETFLEKMLCFLTGAESVTVTNNNAAAILLSLNALAHNKEVLISRGELVEIGGSFRMPEIMEASGAIMKEIGTTNKTKLSDYEKAITKKTGAILVVHTSNYRVMGFSESVELPALVALGKKRKIPVIFDLGGGVLFDFRDFGLPYEPVVNDALKAGVDIVTFSGDKVLGGPQAGIIAGNKKCLDKIKKNPIARAVRCDKLILAGIEGTLKSYLQGVTGFKQLPAIKMMLESPEKIKARAQKIIDNLDPGLKKKYMITIENSYNQAGSGTMPLEKFDSFAIVIESKKVPASVTASKLREQKKPVFGYIKDEKVYLDIRTVLNNQVKYLSSVINSMK